MHLAGLEPLAFNIDPPQSTFVPYLPRRSTWCHFPSANPQVPCSWIPSLRPVRHFATQRQPALHRR